MRNRATAWATACLDTAIPIFLAWSVIHVGGVIVAGAPRWLVTDMAVHSKRLTLGADLLVTTLVAGGVLAMRLRRPAGGRKTPRVASLIGALAAMAMSFGMVYIPAAVLAGDLGGWLAPRRPSAPFTPAIVYGVVGVVGILIARGLLWLGSRPRALDRPAA